MSEKKESKPAILHLKRTGDILIRKFLNISMMMCIYNEYTIVIELLIDDLFHITEQITQSY